MARQHCIICRKPLNDGIIISGKGICRCCEEKMINTAIDTDFYAFYENCIKRSIAPAVIRGEENNWQNYRY